MHFFNTYQRSRKNTFAYGIVVCIGFLLLLIGSVLPLVFIKTVLPLQVEDSAAMNYAELSQYISKNAVFLSQLLPFSLALVGTFFVAKKLLNQGVHTLLTSRKDFDFKRFLFAAGAFTFFILLFFAMDSFRAEDRYVWSFSPGPFFVLVLISVLLLPGQILFEELIFRSLLIHGMMKIVPRPIVALLFSACIFALLHLGNPEFDIYGNGLLLYFIAFALFMGVITYFDNGLELSAGIHFANNLFNTILVSSSWQVFTTDALFIDTEKPSLDIQLFLPMLVTLPLLFFIFKKKYDWKLPVKSLFQKMDKSC